MKNPRTRIFQGSPWLRIASCGVLLAAGCAACAPLPPMTTDDPGDDAIRSTRAGQYRGDPNDATDRDPYPAVQMLVIDSGRPARPGYLSRWTCTAVAIAARTLLTSAQCVTVVLADGTPTVVPPRAIGVVDYVALRAYLAQHADAAQIGSPESVDAAERFAAADRAVGAIYAHPLAFASGSFGGSVGQLQLWRDVAVVTLDADATPFAAVMPVACDAAVEGESVVLVGYGGDTTKRWAANTVDSAHDDAMQIDTFWRWSANAQAQRGDEGGPVLVTRARRTLITGVISHSGPYPGPLTPYSTFGANVAGPSTLLGDLLQRARESDPTLPRMMDPATGACIEVEGR